jgi:hypothetical protein
MDRKQRIVRLSCAAGPGRVDSEARVRAGSVTSPRTTTTVSMAEHEIDEEYWCEDIIILVRGYTQSASPAPLSVITGGGAILQGAPLRVRRLGGLPRDVCDAPAGRCAARWFIEGKSSPSRKRVGRRLQVSSQTYPSPVCTSLLA